jgi:2,3-dihydroxybiphenyl 1,2-dioxygenase
MAAVNELAYVVYEVSSLDDWQHYATAILGMQVGDRAARTMTLRNDDKAARWILNKGPADDLVVSGYEVSSNEALDALKAQLRAGGYSAEEGGADLAAARQADRVVVTFDPMGNRIELVTNFSKATSPFHSEALTGSFLTGTAGAGHQFVLTKDVPQATALNFYVDLLGFRISDRIIEEVAPGIVADAMFLHCNPRHHTIALGELPHPKKTHHFMLQVTERHDVGYAWERSLKLGVPIEMTLGAHPNDQMFSFYAKTPSDFAVEYGWGGLLIEDEGKWEFRTYDRLNSWGHLDPTKEMAMLQQSMTSPVF